MEDFTHGLLSASKGAGVLADSAELNQPQSASANKKPVPHASSSVLCYAHATRSSHQEEPC